MGRRALAGGGALALALGLLLVALLGGEDASTPATDPAAAKVATTLGAELSEPEAAAIAATLTAIDSGGPLPYEQDGGVFQNREGLLPSRPRGHYREYTVETPGSEDRGARRLVIGATGETYYTRDHYNSFVPIHPEEFR